VNRIILGDNLEVLPMLPAGLARLIYIDPPFNTGREAKREGIRPVYTDFASANIALVAGGEGGNPNRIGHAKGVCRRHTDCTLPTGEASAEARATNHRLYT
jgi:hypothetical protein